MVYHEKKLKQREIEMDILRIVALFAVILIHSFDLISLSESNRNILTFISSIVTWQIPVYVMISGRFFLDQERQMPSKKIIKSIWRLVIAFVVWDVIYQVFYVLSGTYDGLNWKGILSQSLIGPYHFWYLYMMICLYAVVPFLRKITEDKKMMEYFIFLFFIFEFLTNYGTELPLIGNTLNEILVKTNFQLALGYSGYYFLGYYIYKYKLSDKMEVLLYVLGLLMILFTGTANTWRAMNEGVNNEWYSRYLLPNVAIEASAIYTFFVKRVSRHQFSNKSIRLITKLAEYSFGVYLIHALVLELITLTGICSITVNPFVILPIIVVGTFIICNIIVGLLRKIPYVGKKIT